MYRVVNENVEKILATVSNEHISDYDWLIQNISDVNSSEYQKKYRKYWAMNAAQLSPGFYATYFDALGKTQGQATTLASISAELHEASARRNGTRSLQFSFATKLLHMTNRHLPIYDSKITKFYYFQDPSRPLPLDQRITQLVEFQTFLANEYARILKKRLLGIAIRAFREKFNPGLFTDEKCIDSLIWAFVILLEKGGLQNSHILYC